MSLEVERQDYWRRKKNKSLNLSTNQSNQSKHILDSLQLTKGKEKTAFGWLTGLITNIQRYFSQNRVQRRMKSELPLKQLHLRSLRPIIVDAAIVGHQYAKCFRKKTMDFKGVLLVYKYFKSRGHEVQVVINGALRSVAHGQTCMEEILVDRAVIFTPYNRQPWELQDERVVVQMAAESGAVIVAELYEELLAELRKEKLDELIVPLTQRVLIPRFTADTVTFDLEPYGKGNPLLEELLRMERL